MSPEEIAALRASCSRMLNTHGVRTPAEMLAEIPAGAQPDRYGDGGVVTELEQEVARMFGKPAALFFPSGTMAQQIAMRIHSDRRGRSTIGYQATSHLELHEARAYQHLHGLAAATIGDPRELMTLKNLQQAVADDLFGAVLFELPQRELGGLLPSWEDLVAQTGFLREQGIGVHLDGARVWESVPFYGRTLAEIAALFDSLYVSFYKGIGGIGGCCLVGEQDMVDAARVWRHRHGGQLFALWPYAGSALGAMRLRLPRMPAYVAHAVAIAAALREVEGVSVKPDPPQTTMMHLFMDVDEQRFDDNIQAIAATDGLFTWPGSSPTEVPGVRVVELSVGDATMSMQPGEIAAVVRRLLS